MEWMKRKTQYSGVGGTFADIPDMVTLGDVPEATGSVVSLGMASDGPVTVDLKSESPHILVNAPTSLGKSTVARSVAVQRLMLGDWVVILDRKMHSHRWARDLAPVVHYADETSDIGSALINLGMELNRRNQVVKAFQGPVSQAPIGSRVIVLFEETNATLTQLRALDKTQGGSYGALDAFADLMFMGSAVKMHVIGFAQLASYRSGLTADLIENFGTRLLMGYSQQAWKWLAADCGRYQVAPPETGRGVVCHAGTAKRTQLLWIDEDSARESVLASLPAQRQARQLSGARGNLPPVWRDAIGR